MKGDRVGILHLRPKDKKVVSVSPRYEGTQQIFIATKLSHLLSYESTDTDQILHVIVNMLYTSQ